MFVSIIDKNNIFLYNKINHSCGRKQVKKVKKLGWIIFLAVLSGGIFVACSTRGNASGTMSSCSSDSLSSVSCDSSASESDSASSSEEEDNWTDYY